MSTSRVVSPSVVASWASHENFADGSSTTLLVLWRGTPGWFKAREGSSSGGGSGGGSSGSSGWQTVSEGGLTFTLEFDYDKKLVKLLNQDVALTETNVILVDGVDGGAGPTIVGRQWVPSTAPDVGSPQDPIAAIIKRSAELFAFLQCEIVLSDPLMQLMTSMVCTQMRP